MDPQGKILIDVERCVRGSGSHEDDIEVVQEQEERTGVAKNDKGQICLSFNKPRKDRERYVIC